MKIVTIWMCVLAGCSVGFAETKKANGLTYTDPAKAAADPDFSIQGEYLGDGYGVQVVAWGDHQFTASVFKGGLPGAGGAIGTYSDFKGALEGDKAVLKHADGRQLTISGDGCVASGGEFKFSAKRVERESQTLGQKPPEGAIVLFDGTGPGGFKGGKLDGDLLCEGTETKDTFKDFHLHIEFRLPFKPNVKPGSQDRGNSGVYIFNNYECQVLDSFGIKPEYNYCGSLYRFKPADVNMSYPPLAWQSYDILFTAPRFEGDKKVTNARITNRHNGVVIQDDVELPKGTGAGGGRPEKAEAQILLQGHGNPVRYRNIWLKPL
ncbi:MAG: hypothetical protein ACI9TH_004181 [Kiritimatiellia bacterium]|jgi:hypothetical protein